MPSVRVIDAIELHFSKNANRVASVVVGPRREGWFNSEAFVALMEAFNPLEQGGFSVYGEENFKTALLKLNWPDAGGLTSKIPDLVGYSADTNAPPVFILEAKLVFDHDADRGLAAIQALSAQLKNARTIVPGVPVIGVVYAARSPLPGDVTSFFRKLSLIMETELSTSEGFDWVAGQPVHIIPGLSNISPGFKGWNCHSSVGIGARVAR